MEHLFGLIEVDTTCFFCNKHDPIFLRSEILVNNSRQDYDIFDPKSFHIEQIMGKEETFKLEEFMNLLFAAMKEKKLVKPVCHTHTHTFFLFFSLS